MADGEGPKFVSYYEWWYADIEEFVKKLWGVKWEGSAAMYFPHQDTYEDVQVTGGELGVGYPSEGVELFTRWMSDDCTYDQAKEIIEKFKAHGMPREEGAKPSLEVLLNWLAFEEHIPTGKYRITVYW